MRASLARGRFDGSNARRGSALAILALAAFASCSPIGSFNGFDPGDTDTGTGTGTGTGGSGGASSSSSSSGDFGFDGGGVGEETGGGAPTTCTPGGKDDDVDKDGFTPAQGDCDDCDPNSNPNAVEVVAASDVKPKDENCNAQIDEVEPLCDQGLELAEKDPTQAVRAADLCKLSTGPQDWGLVEAKWVMANGAPPPPQALANFHLGHGILPGFGANVKAQSGERMLALSSGTARQPNDPGYRPLQGFSKGYTSGSPEGFPKESPACPGKITGTPNDSIGLELKVRVPSNAHGFSFDFDFFTYEWPNFICTPYNDFFVAILSPTPEGQTDGNVSFDSQGNPVSVNNAFLDVCGCEGNPPGKCIAGGKEFDCALGNLDLIGTGFGFEVDANAEDHASTGWLVTKAPVAPGAEITLRWAVYDSGDGAYDTTTLVDHFQWIADAGITVGTTPIPH